MFRYFILMIIALILIVIFSPVVFIVNCFITGDLKRYFRAIAIGLDQLGGSILYSEPDWTISSWTYYLCSKGNKVACYFMKFIDFVFGKNHCRKAFFHEVKLQIIPKNKEV